jgi:hypothetical protein
VETNRSKYYCVLPIPIPDFIGLGYPAGSKVVDTEEYDHATTVDELKAGGLGNTWLAAEVELKRDVYGS